MAERLRTPPKRPEPSHFRISVGLSYNLEKNCCPQLLIPQIPDFLDGDWSKMEQASVFYGTQRQSISCLCSKSNKHRSGVHEALYLGLPGICKIACFGWQTPRIEHKTYTYSVIEEYREPGDPVITSWFLGHMTEHGRTIGMLLENLEGDFACIDDLPAFREALENFHRMNMVHGVNRYNVIIDWSEEPVLVRPVDFEHAEPYEEQNAITKPQSLPKGLAEMTGRDGSVVIFASV